MATARSLIVQPGQFGNFHVVVRCVQQMFLCGRDRSSGKNHQHRRQWIEDRIHALGEIFAVSVHAYAVMSNHLHLVLSVDPELAARWDNFEVAHRAAALYRRSGEDDAAIRGRALSWSDQPERIAVLRKRLGCLGEYMKALNEYVAKKANRESGRKGNFWDDRYKCQRLEDDGALLAAMVYVDLNPIRAKMAADLSSSDHTSAKRRIEQIRGSRRDGDDPVRRRLDGRPWKLARYPSQSGAFPR